MTIPRRTTWKLLLILGLAAAPSPAQNEGLPSDSPLAAPGATPPRGNRHALLVGCTVYPALPDSKQLRGPSNDVELTAKLLEKRFGFTPDEIVTLVHENDAAMRPTRANIAREFAALINRVAAGDNVFIMIGGHGSQIKNDNPNDPKDVELDGFDEVFLPEDVTGWSISKPAEGFIRDDDLGAWLTALRARRAAVFFVADTCHSGTLDRGGPNEAGLDRTRFVDSEFLNGDAQAPPTTSTEQGATAGGSSGPTGIADSTTEEPSDLGPLIALYAVSDADVEHEAVMPPYERTTGPVYGRLSYTLNEVLTRARQPLTYKELAQQIGWRYQGWNWEQEMAFLNGSSQQFDTIVLGHERRQNRSDITLSRSEYDLAIDAGALHGVTVGSIYKVFPPVGAESDDVPAGCVKVTEVTPTTARVEECAFESIPATPFDKFPAPGRCELAYVAASSLKLRIAVAPLNPAESEVDLGKAAEIVREMAARQDALIAPVADGEAADAYLLVSDKGLYLRRAVDSKGGAATESPDAAAFPPDAFGPFAADGMRGSKLDKALAAMAKAANIRRLAESDKLMVVGDPNSPVVQLKVTVERLNAKTGEFGPIDEFHPIDAYDGDKLRVNVFNESGSPVDVTILYIDSAYMIRSYFPTATQVLNGELHNRIKPHDEPASVSFGINDSTIGLEDVIVIATLPGAGTPPQNFAFLEQRGVERGAADPNSARNTPLGQLLATAAFASGDRGGNAAPDIAKYAVHRLSWTVRRGPKPAL